VLHREDQAHHASKVVTPIKNVVQLKSLNTYKNHMQKITTKMSRKIAMFIFDKMKQLKLNVQQVIIEKLLAHPLMQNMFLDYLTNLQCLKAHVKK
jgi:hypothetical protein